MDWEVALQVVVGWKVPLLVLAIVLDWVFGVLVGLRTGTFKLDKLMDIYKTNILPWLLGYLTLASSLYLIQSYAALFDTDFLSDELWSTLAMFGSAGGAAGLLTVIGKSIVANVRQVFGGTSLV